MLYSSNENKKIKELKKLNQKKHRDETNMFLIEGENLVLEAYNSGYLKEILVLENYNLNIDIKTNQVTLNVMKYLSNLDTPPKVIGICLKKQNEIKGNKILMLDCIQDPGNLGTIIRSSVAFNIDTIILGDGSADPYSPKVLRATQGMIFKINIVNENLNQIIPKLKEKNYKIFGTKLNDAKELKTIEKNEKFAIIMITHKGGFLQWL